MNKPLAAALGLTLAGTLAAAVPSYADDPPASPVIVSTGPASQSTEVTITATSEAPYVQFRLFNSDDDYRRREVHSPVVEPNAEGIFVATISARGLNRQHQVYAVNCSTAEASSCGTHGWTRYVYHVRPPGLLNTETQYVHPAHHDAQAVVPDLAGEQAWLVIGSKRVPAVAGTHSLDVSTFYDSSYPLGLQRCSELNPQVCDDPQGAEVVVRRSVELRIDRTSPDPLLSQNRDGYWEDVHYQVFADPYFPTPVRWRITKDGKTAFGPVTLTPAENEAAHSFSGFDLIVDPRSTLGRQLPAGDYRFEIEVTATRDGYRWSTKRSQALHVSNARPISSLQMEQPTIYPRNVADGFKATARLKHALDAREVKYGGFDYRILRADGTPAEKDSLRTVDSKTRKLDWNGMLDDQAAHDNRLAPTGRYRLEVIPSNGWTTPAGVKTWSFAVSHRRRVYQRLLTQPARATHSLVRKARLKYGKIVRGPRGSIDYIGNSPGSGYEAPDLRTLHKLKLPASRLGRVSIRFNGSWPRYEWPTVYLIDWRGRRDKVNVWDLMASHYRQFPVKEHFVHSDGTVRFEIGSDSDGRTRVRTFQIKYGHYRWTN